MRVKGYAALALCVLVLGALAPGGARAEDDRWNKIDLKPLIPPLPPIVPQLPPNSQLSPGGIADAPAYSSAPTQPSSQAPSTGGGLKLTIPTSR